MINIKELSVGNWVKLNRFDEMGKILAVNEDCVITNIAYPVLLEDIEPIPITPEILEKNGFKYHAPMSDYPADYVLAEDYYSIIVNEVTDGLYQFKIVGEEIINTTEIIHASYVHQLQNALTLCGINKNIEL